MEYNILAFKRELEALLAKHGLEDRPYGLSLDISLLALKYGESRAKTTLNDTIDAFKSTK
jgi:hypothetical protein